MTRFRSALLLLAATPFLAGCGGNPKLAAVKGTVTLDDKPLARGTIRFETAGSKPATARIENGEIVEVTTYKPGDGVPIGKHKLAVAATEEAASAVVADPGAGKAPGPGYMGGKSLIHTAYNDPETSGLTAEISAGDNTVTIKLTTKGP